MSDLKPRPFCGESLRAYSEQGGYYHPTNGGCPLGEWEMLADGYSEVRWNTRADTAKDAEIARLREALRDIAGNGDPDFPSYSQTVAKSALGASHDA